MKFFIMFYIYSFIDEFKYGYITEALGNRIKEAI